MSDRLATLRTAVGFLSLEPREPEMTMLHRRPGLPCLKVLLPGSQ